MRRKPSAGRTASAALEVGREADIAVLQIVDDSVMLRDSGGAEREHKNASPRSAIRAGEVFQGRG
jgi:predicted amidohydrolase